MTDDLILDLGGAPDLAPPPPGCSEAELAAWTDRFIDGVSREAWMPSDPANSFAPSGPASGARGDLPPALLSRYFHESDRKAVPSTATRSAASQSSKIAAAA